MPAAFVDIAFTPSVKAAQSRYGSRPANLGFEAMQDRGSELTQREAAFIAERDGFYQATVSETGWPYVQHRGGPLGFLTVLDARTIGYPDFRGNAQYLSVGNLSANDRAALILMDYANRRRLKIWGRARIVHQADSPDWLARLQMSGYRARVERGVIMSVEAYDWNCPQHITPRYSKLEIEHLLAPLMEENQALKAKCVTLLAASAESSGCGPESRRPAPLR
jgi:predicted pyridoxine 5'-phosphate oxidase superfamily flavin-nucleotide-binding protein